MKVIIAYASVVIIWATTPLAVQWSNSSLSFQAAVSARMLGAAVICAIILVLFRKPLVREKSDYFSFVAGGIGMFPNMLLVYWSAQYIPSSLIAVLFGTYPFFTGLFALIFLKQNSFNVGRVVALICAVFGLVIINYDQFSLGHDALYGVLGILASSLLFALSTVLLKKVGSQVGAFRQLSGSLFFAAPGFFLVWYFSDGQLPATIDVHSIIGVIYLICAGSLFGGVAFYYVLTHCQVLTVSLIPLLTPILAIALGLVIQGESFSLNLALGCVCILVSLALYQGVLPQLTRWPRFSANIIVAKLKPLFV